MNCIIDGSQGIYIPQIFAQNFDHWHNDLDADDINDLLAGPECLHYWDAWDNVLQNAEFTDSTGSVYRLEQDGDLFAVMIDNIHHVHYSVCEDCLIAAANDDYSAMTDERAEQVRAALADADADARAHNHSPLIPDGENLGFSMDDCDVCRDGLGGARYKMTSIPQ